jgi:feruloyl-CoA synthase
MQELARQTCGERVMFLTGLGATETGPMALARMWQSRDSTNMGVPVPGVVLKLVPSGGKIEARLRGPSITPGYWRQPELTQQAFDEEGFYKIGDALRFEDPADASAGLLFDGRVAEDFKLGTGTWVNVGPLRARLLAALEPYARDVVIAGADRDEVGALIFPDIAACRELAPGAADPISDPGVIEAVRTRLNTFARTSTGSSNRVCRAILVGEPPSLDAGEMTDKGSINQRAVLTRRAALVDELYAALASPRVIVIDKGTEMATTGRH